jgi:hypothetical protein
MVRTILFTFASLIGVGTMVVMEVETPRRAVIHASEPFAPSTIGFGGSHDTLTKADRLEVTYLRNDVRFQPDPPEQVISPVESIPIGSQPVMKVVSPPWHDPTTRKLAVMLPRPRPKNTIQGTIKMATKIPTDNAVKGTKKATNADRSKLAVEVKSCQSSGFGSLLKVLNLSSGCQT